MPLIIITIIITITIKKITLSSRAIDISRAKSNTNDWSNWFNSFNRGQRPFEVRGYRSTGRGRSGGLITTFFARWIQSNKKRKTKRTATAQTIDRAIITLRSGCYEPQWINRSSGCVRNIGYNWKPPGKRRKPRWRRSALKTVHRNEAMQCGRNGWLAKWWILE